MRKVGGVLAHFHADVREVRDAGSPVLAVERRFERNVHELLVCVEQRGELARVQALGRLAHAFITAHAQTFQARAAGGRVREGHGDLRAEHVLLDGEVQVVDCVEFERGLRDLDVADDLAFLVFDLAAQGGERVGRLPVGAYRDAGGDPGDDSLIAFYAAYRALVGAKIALVRASQLPAGSAEDGHEHARARELIGVAERFAWRARLPLVIVVCGLPASGKSHLARALAEMSGLHHLGSDVTRKRLAGVRSAQRASPESYTLSGTAAPTLSWRAAARPRWKGAAGRSSMPPSVTWPTAKRSPPRWGRARRCCTSNATPRGRFSSSAPDAATAIPTESPTPTPRSCGASSSAGSRSTRYRRARIWPSAPTVRSSRSWRACWLCSTAGCSAPRRFLSSSPHRGYGPARLAGGEAARSLEPDEFRSTAAV